MESYELKCPKCNEPIYFWANAPEVPVCQECDEEVDLDDLKAFICEWQEYLNEREEYLVKKEIREASRKAIANF